MVAFLQSGSVDDARPNPIGYEEEVVGTLELNPTWTILLSCGRHPAVELTAGEIGRAVRSGRAIRCAAPPRPSVG